MTYYIEGYIFINHIPQKINPSITVTSWAEAKQIVERFKQQTANVTGCAYTLVSTS